MDEQSQSQPINIVPMGPEHIETLARLEQACFSSPWSFDALAGELSDPLAVFRVATVNGQVAGYVGMQHILDEGYICNIAVFPEYRRRGVATALVTSNGQAVVREYLAISGFAPYFDQVITGEMTQRSKPAPDIYLLGAKLLGLPPAECAGVEDSVNGVKAIRAAGMMCVMVPDVVPYGPELSPYVDVCLGSLHELEQAIFGKE